MDVVALVSVIFSGSIAVGSVWATHRSGREQRAHERRLAHEDRVWKQRDDALRALLSTTRELLDDLGDIERMLEDERSGYGPSTVEVPNRFIPALSSLDPLNGVVEGHCRENTASAYRGLRRTLKEEIEGGPDAVMRQPEAYELTGRDPNALADLRHVLDRKTLLGWRSQATALLDAAREDIRSSPPLPSE